MKAISYGRLALIVLLQCVCFDFADAESKAELPSPEFAYFTLTLPDGYSITHWRTVDSIDGEITIKDKPFKILWSTLGWDKARTKLNDLPNLIKDRVIFY